MAIDIEVCIAGRFREAAFRDIYGVNGISIADIDFVWGDTDEGSITSVGVVDDGRFIADISMVIQPKRCESWG